VDVLFILLEIVCCEAVRSAIAATVWLLVVCCYRVIW